MDWLALALLRGPMEPRPLRNEEQRPKRRARTEHQVHGPELETHGLSNCLGRGLVSVPAAFYKQPNSMYGCTPNVFQNA